MSPVAEIQVTTTALQDVPVHLCHPNPKNKSRRVDPEFRESIRLTGQRQPALLRMRPGNPEEFEVVDGWRRCEALQELGRPYLRAEIREMSDAEAALEQAIVNKHRAPMTWQQEAELIAECRADAMDFEDIATKLGLEVRQVRRRAQLLKLSPTWQSLALGILLPKWGPGHFEPLAFLSEDAQEDLHGDFPLLDAGDWSVQDVEMWVAERAALLKAAPWDLEDATLDARAGACSSCGERSSAQPDLFGDTTGPKAKDRCLNTPCWGRKMTAWLAQAYARAVAKHGRVVKISKDFQRASADELIPGMWSAAKKGDEGAVAALVVRGAGLGKVEWVTLPGTRRAAQAESEDTAPADESTTEAPRRGPGRPVETNEVKRDRLARQRWARAIEKAIEALTLGEYTAVPRTTEVVAMAIAFGVQSTALNGEPWKALENMAEWTKADLRAALLAQVVQAVVQRLRIAEDPVGEARRACELFGIEISRLKAAADEELPEPAAWSKVNYEGLARTAVQHLKDEADLASESDLETEKFSSNKDSWSNIEMPECA